MQQPQQQPVMRAAPGAANMVRPVPMMPPFAAAPEQQQQQQPAAPGYHQHHYGQQSPVHHHHMMQQQQQHDNGAGGVIEVYSATLDTLLYVPRADILHFPEQSLHHHQQQQGKVSLQMCPCFDPAAENPAATCPAPPGRCKYVHAKPDNITSQDIHVNYLYSSVDDCPYERLAGAATSPLHVAPPNANIATDEIPSHLVLKTRALMSNRRVMSHCAHYYFNRMCNRGAECYFVHAVSLAGGAAPGAVDAMPGEPRRVWGRTQKRSSIEELAANYQAQNDHQQPMMRKGEVSKTNSNKNSRRGSKGQLDLAAAASAASAAYNNSNGSSNSNVGGVSSATHTPEQLPHQQQFKRSPFPASENSSGYATPSAYDYYQQQQQYAYAHHHHGGGGGGSQLPPYAQQHHSTVPGGYASYYQQQQQQYHMQALQQQQQGGNSGYNSGAMTPMYAYTPQQQHMQMLHPQQHGYPAMPHLNVVASAAAAPNAAAPAELQLQQAQPSAVQHPGHGQLPPYSDTQQMGLPAPRSAAVTASVGAIGAPHHSRNASSSMNGGLSAAFGGGSGAGVHTPPVTLSRSSTNHRIGSGRITPDDQADGGNSSGSSLEEQQQQQVNAAGVPEQQQQRTGATPPKFGAPRTGNSSPSTPVSPNRQVRHHNPYSMKRPVISRNVSRDDLAAAVAAEASA